MDVTINISLSNKEKERNSRLCIHIEVSTVEMRVKEDKRDFAISFVPFQFSSRFFVLQSRSLNKIYRYI